MAQNGLLIDYDWCTGCHSCEMACQMEHGMPVGQTGILVNELGPWRISPVEEANTLSNTLDGSPCMDEEVWQLAYLPSPTDQCDLCADRTAKGKVPTCVQHCQAKCIEFGAVEDLAKKLADHPKQVLFAC